MNRRLDHRELDSRRSVRTAYRESAIRVSEDGQPAGEGYLEPAGFSEEIVVS